MDPYDGSTATKFDTLMSGASVPANSCVHLGPGIFDTAGYYDGLSGSGFQAKTGWRIVGSGIDVTTLRLVTPATTQRVYAIAHALSSSTVDSFEVSDLTIDCNFVPAQGTSWAAGAVRVMGNHSRVVRVKVINWGNKNTGTPGFVIAMLTGDPSNGVTGVLNCGIEEGIAVDPHASAAGPVTVLHVGGKESASNIEEAFGIGPYIRNCFVDCGQTTDFTKDFRGLSMAWCKGGVVEGNQVHNTRYGGPYQTATGAQDLAVRNCVYRNVYKGPYWSMSAQGVQRLLVEGNSIEVATAAPNTEYAIQLDSTAVPPTYVHGNIIIRDNRVRYVDSGSGNGNGIRVYNAKNLLVRENVLDLSQAPPPYPLNCKNCGSVGYFENRTPAGVLLRGYNENNTTSYNELETEADEAFILGFIRKR